MQNNSENIIKVNAESSFIFKFFITIPSEIIFVNKENRGFVTIEITSKNSQLSTLKETTLEQESKRLETDNIEIKNSDDKDDVKEKISLIFIGD